MAEPDTPHKIVLTREELYARIWAQPMAVVAPTLWISDVGLRGRCLGMQIPVPPRGHWARKNAGQRVHQPPLPKLDARSASAYAVTEFFRPMPARGSAAAPEDGPVAEQRRFEARPENRIVVTDYTADPHPLVAETMHRYRRAKASEYNRTLQPERGPCLSLNVTAATMPRVLRDLERPAGRTRRTRLRDPRRDGCWAPAHRHHGWYRARVDADRGGHRARGAARTATEARCTIRRLAATTARRGGNRAADSAARARGCQRAPAVVVGLFAGPARRPAACHHPRCGGSRPRHRRHPAIRGGPRHPPAG